MVVSDCWVLGKGDVHCLGDLGWIYELYYKLNRFIFILPGFARRAEEGEGMGRKEWRECPALAGWQAGEKEARWSEDVTLAVLRIMIMGVAQAEGRVRA